MKLTNIKKLAGVSAVALCLSMASGQAFAQTENMTATLITSSAIDTAFVTGMDFGEYFVSFATGDTPTLTLTAVQAFGISQTGAVGNGSQVVQITAPANNGQVTVETPAAADVQMTADAINQFADGAMTLNVVRYSTATEAPSVVTTDGTTQHNVSVLAGATPEPVYFGGDILFTGTPGDNTHSADFDVNFAY